jgi:ankyrin repeat protein
VLTWHDIKERMGNAAAKGDLQELKLYCDMLTTDRRTFSIDSLVNSDDETCLHISVRRGHVRCVEYLLKRGAKANVAGRRGLGAIHLAVIRGDLRILDLLVKAGADITLLDSGNATPLYYGAKYGKTECVRYLLSEHKKKKYVGAMSRYSDVSCKPEGWESPLLAAAKQGHLEIVHLLVESGCHVEQCDVYHSNILHKACQQENTEVIKALIKLKPFAIRQMLTSVCDDGYPIHVACKHFNIDIVNFLAFHGSPVNAFDSHGNTPLMICCRKERYQLVLSLLDAGANPNIINYHDKRSALHFAVEQCDLQSTWLLLQYGGDQRIGDSLNVTPRQIAQQQLTASRSENFVSSKDIQCFQELMDSLNIYDGKPIQQRLVFVLTQTHKCTHAHTDYRHCCFQCYGFAVCWLVM